MKIPSKFDLVLWGLVGLGAVTLITTLFVKVKGWHDDSKYELPAALAQADQLNKTLTSEREARAKEKANADDKSNKYQGDLAGIDAAADLGPVRLCNEPPRVPTTASSAKPAGGSDAATAGRVEVEDAPDPEAGRDIGPELSDFVEDCEANAAQLQRLQEWVRDR